MKTLSTAVAAVILSAVASAADFPLAARDFVAGPNAHVRLVNTVGQAVTAWSVAVITRLANGRMHREVFTADGYLSEVTHGLPGSTERLETLQPGQSREIPLDQTPPDATVEVIAVVLSDGTALGEEDAIMAIFAHRAQERDGLRAVVDTFNDVLSAKRGAAALIALRERLAALAERDDSTPCRAALDAVNTYPLNAAEADPNRVDESLRTYQTFVTREYDLAVRHSQRAP
jgi:hypothetical protein